MQSSRKETKPKKTFHDLKSRVIGILTYEILPRKAVEERKRIVSESTQIDNRDAPITQTFFAKVQNKMHYAVHGNTAAKLIDQFAGVVLVS